MLFRSCAFTVETVDDLRGDDSLGALGLRPVSGEGFMRWFKQQLKELPGYGGAPPRTVLRVDVLKAYVQGLSTLKSANIVVRVRYVSAAKPEPTVKVYRGVEGTVNWANSESEAQAAVHIGHAEALQFGQAGGQQSVTDILVEAGLDNPDAQALPIQVPFICADCHVFP